MKVLHWKVIRAFQGFKDDRIIQLLESAWKDSTVPAHRWEATRRLSQIKTQKSRSIVRKCLHDKDQKVAEMAKISLKMVKNEQNNKGKVKKIIHADMDAFYASIEERDDQSIKGKPIIIARNSERSVVATCNYEARKYGISSAMPFKTALLKCPHAIVIEPRLPYYKEVSAAIFEIFSNYAQLIEPIAYDEAFLDVSDCEGITATEIAKQLKDEVYKSTKLTVSVGVSFTRLLAKLASEHQKPDGLTVVTPKQALDFINNKKIKSIYGIGPVTCKKLNEMNIFTVQDMRNYSKADLIRILNTRGEWFYNQINFLNDDVLKPPRLPKSMNRQRTFEHDLEDKATILSHLYQITESMLEDIIKRGEQVISISLRIRNKEFRSKSKQMSFNIPTSEKKNITLLVGQLLNAVLEAGIKLRAISIRMVFYRKIPELSINNGQLKLF